MRRAACGLLASLKLPLGAFCAGKLKPIPTCCRQHIQIEGYQKPAEQPEKQEPGAIPH